MRFLIWLFCKHSWESYSKNSYTKRIKIEGTWDSFDEIKETNEILVCKKCGKIQKIN